MKALIVDSDSGSRSLIVSTLTEMGHESHEAVSPADCISILRDGNGIETVIIHTESPQTDVPQILAFLKQNSLHCAFIILTSYQSTDIMRRAMESGASYFHINKVDVEHVRTILLSALSFSNLKGELHSLRNKVRRNEIYGAIIGESDKIHNVFRNADRVIDRDVNIIINGATGTGKELLARAIHFGSNRKEGPFVVVNCASITPDIADSLLFGHIKGSFTGAIQDHTGYFEQAEGGTLFLDEIGDMHIEIQAKVLRAIEDKKIRPVGGKNSRDINFRIISATNRDISAAIANKEFRNDLYYRLEQYTIQMPPLHERKEDIPILARYFIDEFCTFYEIEHIQLGQTAINKLLDYHWPGNVRELKNVIRRVAIESVEPVIDDITITVSDEPHQSSIPHVDVYHTADKTDAVQPVIPLEELEKNAIRNAFLNTDGNVEKAAKLLGISRATLYRKLIKYSIK